MGTADKIPAPIPAARFYNSIFAKRLIHLDRAL